MTEPSKQEPIDLRLRFHGTSLDDYTEAGDLKYIEDLQQPSEGKPANLVSSLCMDGVHRPAIDIDIPCQYVESSTPGHGHLYFPTLKLNWDQYSRLLVALGEAGIVEKTYVKHSLKRGQTLLRPPGVKKERKKKGDEKALWVLAEEVQLSVETGRALGYFA